VNYESLEDAEMRALARDLGVSAADRLDPDAMATAVVRRLREPYRPARAAVWQPLWMSAAAAVVLLLGGGVMWRTLRPPARPAVTAPAGLDLGNLSTDQLREVLEAVDHPIDIDASGSAETGLDDLTPPELRSLLLALEG
jgi:hypothetical protein